MKSIRYRKRLPAESILRGASAFLFAVATLCFMVYTTEQHHAHADTGIGKVEHGAEEHKVLSAHKWHPHGPLGLDEGEVEHIYHLTHEERRIARAKLDEI